MAQVSGLIELRNAVDEIYQKMRRESDRPELLNEEILARVKRELGATMAKYQSSLVDMSLTKLLNDVTRRRGKSSREAHGPDLFGHISGIPHSVSIGRGRKKSTAALKVSEARKWLDTHPPKPAKDPHKALRQFVLECVKQGAAEDETLGDYMKRSGQDA